MLLLLDGDADEVVVIRQGRAMQRLLLPATLPNMAFDFGL